jgi:hypothetical protein
MAAATLRLDRWQAGARLMQSANPQGWAQLIEASRALDRESGGAQAPNAKSGRHPKGYSR